MQEHLSAELAAEYRALTQQWGWVDVSDRTQVEVAGADRSQFLNGFCTNDLLRLSPGTGCETFFTSVKGKTIGHAFVFCALKSLLLDTSPGQSAALIAHLERYIIREDVQLNDLSATWGEVFVGGSEARRGLAKLLAAEMPSALLDHDGFVIDGNRVYVRRVPLAAEAAYLVSVPRPEFPSLAARLSAAGATACSPAALEIVRVEAGMPQFGRDISDQNLVQEVNRDSSAVSFTKGCYLGQETVARIDAVGHVNRLLVPIRWQGPMVPAADDVLRVRGQAVGHVTSAVWSPYYESPLGLAYLHAPHHAPGTVLESAAGPAEVLPAGPRVQP